MKHRDPVGVARKFKKNTDIIINDFLIIDDDVSVLLTSEEH